MAEDAVMWLALDDARHEFETGLRFLQDRLPRPARKGARRHDDSPR